MIPLFFRVPTTGRVYATVFCFFLFIWPVLLGDFGWTVVLAGFTIMVASYLFCYWRCSSAAITYWQGLCLISASLMSGCVNVSAIVIPTILAWVHWRCVVLSCIDLAAGRPYAALRFLRICHRRMPKAFDLEAAEALIASVRAET
jgi:hypothetical protein